MLLIEGYDKERNYRTLALGPDLFHRALECVLLGEKRFHVKNQNGEDFDLLYTDNQSWAESSLEYPDSPLFHQDPLYPPYIFYDEHDEGKYK